MRRSSVDDVLDATYQSVLAVGVRRTTFAEVARRANMSRATLYTHFDDVDAAIAALLTRELMIVLDDAVPDGAMSGRSRLLAIVERLLAVLPAHPLLARALELDANLLLPYVVDRLGEVQQRALAVAIEIVEEGQADGSIRGGDPEEVAYAVLLTVRSAVLADRVTRSLLDADSLSGTVVRILDGGLAA